MTIHFYGNCGKTILLRVDDFKDEQILLILHKTSHSEYYAKNFKVNIEYKRLFTPEGKNLTCVRPELSRKYQINTYIKDMS